MGIPAGQFISFEGIEGSGKSTQAQRLAQFLEQLGKRVIVTREPGGTTHAEHIRELLVKGEVNSWHPISELLLYLAARNEHVEQVIKPALAKGQWVVCDRFCDSTTAYQGYGHGLNLSLVERLQHEVVPSLQPHLTILLDLEAKDGLARTQLRKGEENRYERMEISFHERVRQGFLTLAQQHPNRIYLCDANQPIQDIAQQIELLVRSRFFKNS